MLCAITIVCAPKLATGFALTGIDTIGINTRAAAEEALSELLKSKRMALILVSREIMNSTSERLQERLRASKSPLFMDLPIVIPDREQDDRHCAREYVSEVVQHAIGQKINIGL